MKRNTLIFNTLGKIMECWVLNTKMGICLIKLHLIESVSYNFLYFSIYPKKKKFLQESEFVHIIKQQAWFASLLSQQLVDASAGSNFKYLASLGRNLKNVNKFRREKMTLKLSNIDLWGLYEYVQVIFDIQVLNVKQFWWKCG